MPIPKSAKVTRELPSSKSSTIHSTFSSQRAEREMMCLVTVCPVLWFSMTAEPVYSVEAVTVSLMVSPSEISMPEKS